MRPKAILFDVDGTLAETEELHRLAFNQAFREHGLDWEWDQPLYRKLLEVTGGKERLTHYMAAYDPPGAAEMRGRVAALHAAKTKAYAELVASGAAQLRPGVARLMLEAHEAGIAIGLATTTSPQNVSALLETAGRDVAHTISVIAAGDVVPRKKPAPDIYFHALERLRLHPAECVAVEDSGPGVASALAAGLPTLVTRSAYTDPGPCENALCLLSDLGERNAPYTHLGGRHGREDGHVTLAAITRWLEA